MPTVNDLPEKVRKAVEESLAGFPQRWRTGVCAWEVFDPKSGELHKINSAAGGYVCHAPFNRAPANCILVNAHRTEWQRTNKEFLLWVCQESPFSHGVLNKDNEEELLNHGAVIDTRIVGKGGALWLVKAVRHFEEDAFKLKTWTDLRKGGLDGFQAFVGADILTMEGAPSWSNTHVSLFCYTPAEKLRELYDEIRTIEKIDATNANRGGYGAYGYEGTKCSCWGSLKGKTKRQSDGWGGFIEVPVPCEPADYIKALKEIFEGDPKRVK